MKALVQQAHGMGMKVILDWVANHTAWDHPWAKSHKDWYKLNAKGELFPVNFTNGPEPEYWTDVIALNYENRALWRGMIDADAFGRGITTQARIGNREQISVELLDDLLRFGQELVPYFVAALLGHRSDLSTLGNHRRNSWW